MDTDPTTHPIEAAEQQAAQIESIKNNLLDEPVSVLQDIDFDFSYKWVTDLEKAYRVDDEVEIGRCLKRGMAELAELQALTYMEMR